MRASIPYRVFEAFDERAADQVRWIAAADEAAADAARIKRGWRKGAEVRVSCVPTDPKGLKQMGVDVIVKP